MFVGVYAPPSSPTELFKRFLEMLRNYQAPLLMNHVMNGDFNAKNFLRGSTKHAERGEATA